MTAQAIIDRVQLWWANRNEDWPHDAGALDLLHYFEGMSDSLYTYSSSAKLNGEVTLTKRGEDWHHWSPLVRSGGRDEQFSKRIARPHVAEAIGIGMLTELCGTGRPSQPESDRSVRRLSSAGFERKALDLYYFATAARPRWCS